MVRCCSQLAELIETSRLAVDELIDVLGRATILRE